MRYRARRIGAELLVESDTLKGTTITLEIRLPSLDGTTCG
jgi:signal transduction histidine kinase